VSSAPDLTSRILRHERLVVAGGIALLVGLGWWSLLTGGAPTGGSMAAMGTPPFAAVAAMWWLMMAAMMLPSATPAILLYAQVRVGAEGSAVARPAAFLAGYLVVWLLFSLVAATAQRLLTGPSMALGNRTAEAALLVLAGLYQLSPLKGACLRQCRAPAQFLSRHWRPGVAGAVRLGIVHGGYCVGCCWVLMALLFVGGVMNIVWIAALTLIVAVEKLASQGQWIGRAAGVGLIAWGAAMLFG
jgi:predicted metal-binding membrane protein